MIFTNLRFLLLIFFLLAFPISFLKSQETNQEEDRDKRILEMDIRTSTLSELATWCRSLGLSENGTREELANRLRAHYGLTPPPRSTTENERIITIESAQSTEYFTLEVVDEEYARLQGGVIISLKEEGAVHRIKATTILYNRTRNIMTAEGNVEYVKEEGDTIERFSGESITVNLDNWSSIFLDGSTEKGLSTDSSVYRFSGTVISRSDEDVTVLSRASVTNAKNEEALWSLDAYKLWLLPGSDWAVLSAVLKVGEIPVFYFPFFHFPADEPIFHPSLGYRTRTGNFFQTTTYILGRTQSEGGNSLSKIMGGGADTEKVREGVFLRSTGKKVRDNNNTRLSVLFDYYANLGAYIGSELTLPKRGILETANFSSGVAFSRDIYRFGNVFTPFNSNGEDSWNTSNLFSVTVPFRYRFNTTGSLRGGIVTLNWSFLFYSDMFTDRDFLDRTEVMDWISLFKMENTDVTSSINTISTFEWRLSANNINYPVTKLNPYITSFTIPELRSTLAFGSRSSPETVAYRDPTNWNFFFPNLLTIYSISSNVSGIPLTLGNRRSQDTKPKEVDLNDIFHGIGIPISPWKRGERDSTDERSSTSIEELRPPVLNQRFTIPLGGGPRFSFGYRFAPSSAMQMQFRSSQQNWRTAEDVDWNEISHISTTFNGNIGVNFTFEQPETNLYKSFLEFTGLTQWHGYTYINEEAENFTTNGLPDEKKIQDMNLVNYKATWFNTNYRLANTFSPLYRSAVFKNSSLQYDLAGRLSKTEFDGTAIDPSWTWKMGEWIPEEVSTHRMTANLVANIMDYNQNLSLYTDMPPRDTTLGGSATARVWITETSISHRVKNPWEEEREFENVTLAETIRFGSRYPFRFTQTIIYTPKEEAFTRFVSDLSWAGFTANFTTSYTRTFNLETSGWVQSTEPESLNPISFGLAYSNTFRRDKLWNNRFAFSVSPTSRLTFDLQRYTYSNFTFDLTFTMNITNFMTIRLNSQTENKEIFRYFQRFSDLPHTAIGEENVLIDLLNSFRFDNDVLRRSSGFKIKSFSLDIVHHLGDWNAKFNLKFTPYLDNTVQPYRYRFNNEISFVVQWIPMTEIKTEIFSDKDNITIK